MTPELVLMKMGMACRVPGKTMAHTTMQATRSPRILGFTIRERKVDFVFAIKRLSVGCFFMAAPDEWGIITKRCPTEKLLSLRNSYETRGNLLYNAFFIHISCCINGIDAKLSASLKRGGARMKRLIPLLFMLALPAALFAQSQPSREAKMLTQFGLNDTQVSQVMDIQKKAMTTVRQDRVHIRLLRAQMAQDLLPAKVDMQAVNDLITQEAQTRADMQKAFVGARVQLRQIMGDDAFHMYVKHFMAIHRRGWMRRFRNERMHQEWGAQMDEGQQGS